MLFRSFIFFKSRLIFTLNDLKFLINNGCVFLNFRKLHTIELRLLKNFYCYSFIINKNFYIYYFYYLQKIKKLRVIFYKKFFKIQKLKLNFYKQKTSIFSNKFINLVFFKKYIPRYFEVDFFSLNFIVFPHFFFYNFTVFFFNKLLAQQYN